MVKNALIHSDGVGQGIFQRRTPIKPSTYGIIFMGVPNQEGQMGELLLNIAKMQGRTSESPSKYLKENSELLKQHMSEFTSISRDFEITFAYEAYPTPIGGGKAIEVS